MGSLIFLIPCISLYCWIISLRGLGCEDNFLDIVWPDLFVGSDLTSDFPFKVRLVLATFNPFPLLLP